MELVKQGKVRNVYKVSDDFLILETSDRISAFDRVLPGTVPGKGKVLNQMSIKWFDLLKNELGIPNHIVDYSLGGLLLSGVPGSAVDRSVLVRNLTVFPFECIVRGYYIPTSSSWDSYKENGTINGIALPLGLQESEQLPDPIFTPSTKAEVGQHDENITFDEMVQRMQVFLREQYPDLPDGMIYRLAEFYCEELESLSLEIYKFGHEYAYERGIILADTKLEFALDEDGDVVLVDECLTPDSSRYWPRDSYEVGKPQPSMDKQFLRDYLKKDLKWDGSDPIPEIPDEFYERLSEIYSDIFARLF